MKRKFQKVVVCLLCFVMFFCEVAAFAESFKEVQKKAKNDDVQAQYDLGMMYYTGNGTKKNFSEAFKWWLKAAKHGHPQAQRAVGTLYDNGEGVKKNPKEAFKWMLKAAENGDMAAQSAISSFYSVGWDAAGVKPNQAEAEKWKRKLTEPRKHELSDYELHFTAINYEFKDKAKAIEIYRGLVEREYVPAYFSLGLFCCREKNYEEAYKWLIKSGEHGNAYAQCILGSMYYNGEGGRQDYSEAAKWYRKAADNGHTVALYDLGMMYYEGKGVEKDEGQAVKLWKKAEKQGSSDAAHAIKVVSSQKATDNNTNFLEFLSDLTDILNLANTVAGAISDKSSNSSPKKVTKTLKTGKTVTYTARTVGGGEICPNCFGDGRCHVCMLTKRSASWNNCHVCHGSGTCQKCNGYGHI